MTVIVEDHFLDTDAVSLDAHTPDVAPGGSAWVERLGNWQITSNAAALATATNAANATIDTGQADCVLTVEANSTTTSTISTRDVGIVARWVDVDNYFRIGINAEADQFRIAERVAGINTLRATVAVTITPGTLYTIQVTLSGASITATLDGGNQINYGSATAGQSSTLHGIMARETADRLDDFLVETAGGGSTYEMSATLTVVSDTNTPAMQVQRWLAATSTGVSDTTTASLQVVRPLASTLTAQSNTGDITLNIVRQISAILTAVSDTNTAALYVLRPSSATLIAISNTSDIELITAGLYEMAATLTAISNTSEASLQVIRPSSATLTAVSSTNEIILLVSGILEMAATLTAQSSTNEIALSVLRASLATLTAASNTSNVDLLKYLNSAATLTGVSSTSSAALQVIRQAAATLTAQGATNEAALQVIRRLSATLTAQSNTSDVTLLTSIIVGLMTASFSARQPSAGFSAEKPGVTFTVSQPRADFDT